MRSETWEIPIPDTHFRFASRDELQTINGDLQRVTLYITQLEDDIPGCRVTHYQQDGTPIYEHFVTPGDIFRVEVEGLCKHPTVTPMTAPTDDWLELPIGSQSFADQMFERLLMMQSPKEDEWWDAPIRLPTSHLQPWSVTIRAKCTRKIAQRLLNAAVTA